MKRNLLIRLTCLSIFTVWSLIGYSQVKTNGTILGKVTISDQGSVTFEPISKTPQAVKKPLESQRFENLTSQVPGVINKNLKVSSNNGETRSKMSLRGEKQNVENLQLLYLNNCKQTFLSSEYELFAVNNISLIRLYGEKEYFISPTTNNIKQYKARIRAASSADSGKIKVQFHFVDVNLSPGVKDLLKTINIYIPDFINDKIKLSIPDCDIQLLQQQNVPIEIDHSYGKVRSLTNFREQTLQDQYKSTSTIWSEGFEGAFPGTDYYTGDAEPLNGLDYWDDVSCDKHSGSWSIWCAANGDQPDCVNYDDNMSNYVGNINAISVAGYSDVNFTFWTKYNTETGYDNLKYWASSDGYNYSLVTTYEGNSGGWIQKSFTLTGYSDYYWEFDFNSDDSYHSYIGAYLDDMEITASCANLTKQTDNITISGTTVSYDVTVINNGTGSAQASELGYYLSTSTLMTTNYLLGTDNVPALASSATSHQTFSVDVLSVTPVIPPGIYYASYIIDDLDQVPECDETDNMWVLSSPTVIVPAAYCSGTTTLTSATGSFTDGSGTNDYNYNSDCKWLIQPAGATSITLSFSAFSTEPGWDFVTVYDGSTTSGTVLGHFSGTSIPANVTSTGGSMLVYFTSDNSINAAGWSASYTSSTAPLITVAPTSLVFGNVQISTSSSPQTYTVSGSGLTANIVITAPTGYGICFTSGGTYLSTLTLTQTGGIVSSTTIYVKFSPTLVQAYNNNITNTSTGATTKNVAVTGSGQNCTMPTTPTIGTITHPTCAVATGSVVISSLPSTITWTLTRYPGGTTSTGTGTSTTVSGIAAGTYYFTVTNSTGCTSAASATVVINAQPAVPTAPTVGTITHPTCTVATGSVVLSGLPASGTWTLTRTPGAITTTGTGTSTTVSGIAAGTYTFTVTNSVLCISVASSSVVINTQPTTPTAPTVGTITHPTCTVATGSVLLSGLPATGTWTLTRTPGAITTTGTGTSTTVTGIAAGTYTYTVTNASGCTSTASANVVINAQPAVSTAPTVGTITHPTCTVATGSVVLSGLPASVTWTLTRTPGAITTTGTGTSTTITGLAAGTYTYTVTIALGCASAASANVVINAQPVTPSAPIVGTIVQPTCTEATGSVVLDGLPSSGTWTLTRAPGGTTTTGTGASTTISGLAAGTYTYTVTNASGCTSVASANVVINAQPATPTAPTVGTITHPSCTVSTGSVILSGLPASGTWTLTITPGGTTTTGTGASTTISALAAGTYTYKVTNSYGCISVASGNVVINTQPPTPTAPAGSITQPKWSVATGSVVLTGLPSTGTWTITRSPGGTTATGSGTSSSPQSGLAAGTYTWTVTNSFGCTSGASANLVIQSQPVAPGSLTASSCNDKVSLKWRKSGDANFYRYRIYLGLATNPTTKVDSSSTAATDTSKVISGLIRGQTYYILVTTVIYDVKGAESNFSSQQTVIVKTGVIPRVKTKWNSLLICSNVSDSIKSFQWYKNGNSISGATIQYYNTSQSPGVYTVETIDLNGCKNSSVDKTISMSGTNTISVYPNPASVSFALKLNDESGGTAVVSITNSAGIKVMEFQTENFNNELLKEVPVNSLNEGIYIVKVLLDNKNLYYTKIVIIK